MIGKLKKGRFFLEYAALTAIIVIAVLGMQTYLRRAFSGRFRELSDQVGDQYDPQAVNGTKTVVISSAVDEYMVYADIDSDGENEYAGSRVHSINEQTFNSTETITKP